MKIVPVASAAQAAQQPQSTAQTSRAAAIAAFERAASPQPQQPIVQNQNAIQPEEMGAIKAKDEEIGQSDTIEATEETEATAPAVVEQPPKEDPAISRKFAQLARQEQAIRAREAQIKAREDALKASTQVEQPKTDLTNYISKDRFKSDPLSVLAEAGIQYDDLVQQLINQPTVDPRMDATINELRNEIKALRQQDENRTKQAQEQQTQQYQAAIKQIETDTRQLVTMDPNFETIKATNSVKDVVQLIEQTYAQDGILLSVEEAAQQVEDYLVEEAFKLTKIGKIQKRLQPVAPKANPSTVQQPVAQQKQPQPMKTLTNTTSSNRQLSAKERAILAFRGELKS